ncbi:unnamed protein product [Diatraea saccharalis]|uniref:Lipase domain-containing protein n=1 Tax=Diatraea saccharalis TaxID=40085 RepID=A0A9N9QXQ8_9NEOP|nr:unnamed protein product [Diatraea saccharalis]
MCSNFNNVFSWIILLFGSAAKFRFYKTFTDYMEVPVETPDAVVASSNPYVDVNKPTYLIAIGFNFKLEGPLLTELVPALLNLGDRNVCLVNWVNEASAGILGEGLGYALNALPNSKTVGEAVGKGIVKLVNLGLKNDIHFIGHSLGAQLAGYAGRETIKHGINLTEIIALDAARLGYEPPSLYQYVDKSCATLVYAVHCDVNGYALNITLGHVDFWPNFGNYESSTSIRLQPGCLKGTTLQEILTNGNRCSHDYCYKFYVVSLTNPGLFVGSKANNYFQWKTISNVNANNTNFIGPLINPNRPGNFYFVTGSTNPWGLGANGLQPPTTT